MLSKGNIINNKIRVNSTTQVNTVTDCGLHALCEMKRGWKMWEEEIAGITVELNIYTLTYAE
jgi:hypothetical protein